jgi:diguanylate cyclase (GGDEF)-like protein
LRINVAKKQVLELILERKRWDELGPDVLDLKQMFKTILKWANEFFPSESGSILLDNPLLKHRKQKKGRLYFVACFGKGSAKLTGKSLPYDVGIVGKTYTTGKPYISKNVKEDEYFYGEMDKKTKFHTKSIICAPIEIRGSVIGVIELINRLGSINYSRKDLDLLKVFASYTSTLIQNSLDAKRFRELSIRDNLTGLYNDRYFFKRLSEEIRSSLLNDKDMSLIILDLDWFKEVNDTYGHLAGSHLLSEVGTILMNLSEEMDSIPIRYGGDEFAVILPEAEIDSAGEFATNLRKSIERHVFLKRRVPGTSRALKLKGLITCSIGVASLKTNLGVKRTVKHMREAVIKRADVAMYWSKQSGKNKSTLATAMVPT